MRLRARARWFVQTRLARPALRCRSLFIRPQSSSTQARLSRCTPSSRTCSCVPRQLRHAESLNHAPPLSPFRRRRLSSTLLGSWRQRLDLANHEEFVAKMKDKKFPKDKAVLLAKGVVKIESSGSRRGGGVGGGVGGR